MVPSHVGATPHTSCTWAGGQPSAAQWRYEARWEAPRGSGEDDCDGRQAYGAGVLDMRVRWTARQLTAEKGSSRRTSLSVPRASR